MVTKKKTAKRARPKASERNGDAKEERARAMGRIEPFPGIFMDAMVVKLASEPLQEQFGMIDDDGVMSAKPGFAVALDKALTSEGYESTPSIAITAWILACDWVLEHQKKTS